MAKINEINLFKDLFVESEIVAEGSIKGVLNGKHENRSVRAFPHMLFDMYLQSLPSESQDNILEFIGKVYF